MALGQSALNLKNHDIGSFSYDKAFSRSLGWITTEELRALSQFKVGIVGVGGVGGQYVEVLSRLGVQNFVLCDFDEFSVENTNRQNECRVSNYNRNKAQVLGELALDINPQARVEIWSQGLKETEVDKFCDSVDIYLDGLDFFEINLRLKLFGAMKKRGKPAITAGPIGTGTTFLYFGKETMSFEDYFGITESDKDVLKYAKFLVGLDTGMHMSYLQDPTRLDLKNKKAPSLPMGVYSCASIMGSAVLKLALKRGPLRGAPWVFHYDPYKMKSYFKRIHFGSRNWFQKLKVYLVLKRYASLLRE